MGTPLPEAPQPLPWLFFIVAIVAAVLIGSVIAYLGLTGHLGAVIPGAKAPSGGITVLPILGLALTASARARRGSLP